jgi:SAM-dependent methyltransferase
MIASTTKLKAYLETFVFKRLKLMRVLHTIKKQYKPIETYSISKQYRDQHAPDNPDLIYGELNIKSFIYLLSLVSKQGKCKIIDLGCGDGKLIIAASLYFKQLQVSGIELAKDLATIGQSVSAQLKSKADIIHGDILSHDFTDVDIVYMSVSAFEEKTWQAICQKLQALPKDRTIISVARKLEGPFQLIYVGSHRASWGPALVYIYNRN